MKLAKILTEIDNFDDFDTKKVGSDDTTGQITWDVIYTPLISMDKGLEEMLDDFKGLLKKYPEDQRLEQLYDVFTKFKRGFRAHITKKYK